MILVKVSLDQRENKRAHSAEQSIKEDLTFDG